MSESQMSLSRISGSDYEEQASKQVETAGNASNIRLNEDQLSQIAEQVSARIIQYLENRDAPRRLTTEEARSFRTSEKDRVGNVPCVAFSATLTKQLSNLNTGQVIIFDNVIANEGSGYDANYGIFTAPIDGMYSFSWSFLTYVTGHAHLYLYKNDKEIFRTYAGDSSNRHETGGATINMRLSRGDKVSLKSGTDGGNLHNLYCVFTGNILHL